jgi:D-alanyl-D-alanine carboxypeptidase
VLCAVLAIAVTGCATTAEPVERMQTSVSSSLVRSFEQLVKATAVAVPDAPAVLLHVELPRRGLVWDGAAGPGAPADLARSGSLRIASNTKSFVAATLLVLSERGRIELDAPVARWLQPTTESALRRVGYESPHITLRMLLQHTSGLRDHSSLETFLLQVKAQPQRRWTRADQLAIALEAGAPLAPPGDLFHYSDTGYILLGEVIEVVTGAPLPAAIRRTLDFERLGLRDTWFKSLEPIPPHAPARQLQLLDGIDAMRFDPSIDLYGGGGLVSTLPDLARLVRAAVRGSLFAHESTAAAMREPSTASRAAQAPGYGMGLSRMEHAGLVCHGHGGFWGTDAWHCPAIDLTVTAAVTTTTGRAALRAMTMDAIRLAAQVHSGC